MTETTPLDRAHAAMTARPDDEQARLAYFATFADAELFLLMENDRPGAAPRIFALSEGEVCLAFDSEQRLAEFSEEPVPYAALSGRGLASLLQGRSIGVGVNLGVAPSAWLLPADALAWIREELGAPPGSVEREFVSASPLAGSSQALVEALVAELQAAPGVFISAYLAAMTRADGSSGAVLAVIGAAAGSEPAITGAVRKAFLLADAGAGAIDVVFLAETDPLVAALREVGVAIEPPRAVPAQGRVLPSAPGSDPSKPPILR